MESIENNVIKNNSVFNNTIDNNSTKENNFSKKFDKKFLNKWLIVDMFFFVVSLLLILSAWNGIWDGFWIYFTDLKSYIVFVLVVGLLVFDDIILLKKKELGVTDITLKLIYTFIKLFPVIVLLLVTMVKV